MNSIEEFEVTNSRPPATYEQSSQHIRPSSNFQQPFQFSVFPNSNYQNRNYQSIPRQVIRPPNPFGSPILRKPCYTNGYLANNTSNNYRPALTVQNSLQNYQSRAQDFRPGLYPSTSGSSSNSVRHPYQIFRHPPSISAPNYAIQPVNDHTPQLEYGSNQQPTRILQKPTDVPLPSKNRGKSLSTLNPATVTVSIPLTSMINRPANMMDIVDNISKRTETHIFAYDGVTAQDHGTGRTHARYCIYGKWRDCLEAGKMLGKKLTKPFTAYIHESWSSFIDRKIPRSNSTLRNLYPVDIRHIHSMKVLAITGYYWDVLKIRKELVLRQKKKVTKMSGDLLIVDYASDSGSEENESVEILGQIKSDIESSLNETLSRAQNLATSFGDKNYGNTGSSNSLKATEMMKLLIGPGTSSPDQGSQEEIEELENEEPEETAIEQVEEDEDWNISMSNNEQVVKVPSVVFVPGECVPIFSSELYEQEDDIYTDAGKSLPTNYKPCDIEGIDEDPVDESIIGRILKNNQTSNGNEIFAECGIRNEDLSRRSVPLPNDENEPTILDDIETLEDIEFPTD